MGKFAENLNLGKRVLPLRPYAIMHITEGVPEVTLRCVEIRGSHPFIC